ncbi:MAG: GreA/GreB family elongation factor [Patescibacteria group bacterium]
MERGQQGAIEESKAHKGAMASRYDTFKEEAQYLAGGFAARIQELSLQLAALKSMQMRLAVNNKVSSGAIVEIEDVDTGVRTKYFLLPVGGGNIYEVNGKPYSTLTIRAPLARALFGKTEGDEVEIIIQGTTKRLLIVSVS